MNPENNVTPTEGFLTTDGEFFMDKIAAMAHQHRVNLAPEIEAFVGTGSFYHHTQIQSILKWEEHKRFKELGGMK